MGILVGSDGEYRHLSLQDIIDTFKATYVGAGKVCKNVSEQDVVFHATRALQELSYDTMRSTKDLEVEIPPSLTINIPNDYVNYVKLSWSDPNGIERIIYPTSKTSNPEGGTVTWDNYRVSSEGGLADDSSSDHYHVLEEARHGLDPQYAQVNGSFFIDESAGKFYFSGGLAGKTLVLRYIGDGLVTTSGALDHASAIVPKLAEEAMYKHMLYGVLSARSDTPPFLLQMAKKERFAEVRKAKLRLSNLKSEELAQVMRGQSKTIKH